MQQGEFEKKEQLELHTDEYIANFDFFVNCSEQPKEWLDWLKVLGLSVIDAKRINEELALLPDKEIANAELAALSLASSKYLISKQDILLEKILPPSCYADKIRLAVLKRVLMANKFSNPQDKWQASQDNKIRHKLTEINQLLEQRTDNTQQFNSSRKGVNGRRDLDAIKWVNVCNPNIEEMTITQIHEALKTRNLKLWIRGFLDWHRNQEIWPKKSPGSKKKQ